MVKFMIKGGNIIVRMCGHSYQGDTVYDNDFCRLPEDVIRPYIIDEKPVKKVELVEPEVEVKVPKLSEDELYALNKAEQVELLKSKGLSDKEIKALSTEAKRVAKLLE